MFKLIFAQKVVGYPYTEVAYMDLGRLLKPFCLEGRMKCGHERSAKCSTKYGVDNGYRYGSNWLKENVPTDVLEWLFSLPGVGACFSDVCLEEIGEDDFNMILNSN